MSQAFYCKLVPPRASFAQDMSPDEARAMQAHGLYWRGLLAGGKVVAFGLVGDPKGAFGVGIIEVDDAAEAKRMTDQDPAILAGHGHHYEIHLMPFGAVSRSSA